MPGENGPEFEYRDDQPLNEAELDEIQRFVRGPLRDYLLQHENGLPLYRKAGLDPDSELAEHILGAGDKEGVIAMPVRRRNDTEPQQDLVTQADVYRMVKILQRLIEIGASESH
ncbi:MAG: hypothetical protein PHY34_03220 [Patescibacteria group bacterium]|nr:hypothetical protein [Patescibacteria group bacterium]MDD5716114.1 hypothetical protein [Patescibacteria group bacterium]